MMKINTPKAEESPRRQLEINNLCKLKQASGMADTLNTKGLELTRKKFTACRKTLAEINKTCRQATGSELQDMLDKINSQLLWTRQAQSELEASFEGRHAESLREELRKTVIEAEKLVCESIIGRKFNKSVGASETLQQAVGTAKRLLLKQTNQNALVGEIVTTDLGGAEFLTVFLVVRDIKIIGNDIIPFYVIAISKEQTQPNFYITHLSSLTTVFSPTHRWTTVNEMTFNMQRQFTWHFSDKYGLTLEDAVKYIDSSEEKNGQLIINLIPDCSNIEDIMTVIFLTLNEEVEGAGQGYISLHHVKEPSGRIRMVLSLHNNRVWLSRIPHITKTLKIKQAA
jgi:hypothetical protein